MKTNQKYKKGFTLIELLVVIAIIALLSSVVLASVTKAREKAQISKVRSEIAEFVKALEIYRTAYAHYPSCINNDDLSCGFEFQRDGDYPSIDELDPLMQELKDKKVYSGDIRKTILSLPSSANYLSIYYINTESDLASYNDPTNGFYCGDKKNFNSYYLQITLGDNSGDQNYFNFDLSSSYLYKERARNGLTPQGDGSYCTGE